MYRFWDRKITRRSENACIVADVAAQQHERAGLARGSDKATKMANCMSRTVKKIETTISKVVESWETTDVEDVGSLKRDLAKIASPE